MTYDLESLELSFGSGVGDGPLMVLRPFNGGEPILQRLAHFERKKIQTIEKKNLPPLLSIKQIPEKQEWCEQASKVALSLLPNEKAVFARIVSLEFESAPSISALQSFLVSKEKSGLFYAFSKPNGDAWIGLTPEKLFSMEGLNLSTHALAATYPTPPQTIENKEGVEHSLVVDWIDKKLSCGQLVSKEFKVKRLSHLCHLETKLSYKMPAFTPIKYLKALHPTPALAGSPFLKAKRLIADHEDFDREYYGGAFGFIEKNRADFHIAIRGGRLRGNRLDLFVGAGILKESNPLLEWDETENKLAYWSCLKILPSGTL